MEQYYFPFGEKLRKVEQKDRSPKKVFVLGVYASAVHARWLDRNGRQKVLAMAVASEPEIFWKGENAAEIIERISIPAELGRLVVPGNASMNGPSGKALDDLYLNPLGYDREDAWLCDLLPESRVNERQREALDKNYTPDIISKFGLKQASIPDFNKSELDSVQRRNEILSELEASKAESLILLGDLPIQWFLKFYSNTKHRKLSDFGNTPESYGCTNVMVLNGKSHNVIPLCHPRQAGQLGTSSTVWGQLHRNWIKML